MRTEPRREFGLIAEIATIGSRHNERLEGWRHRHIARPTRRQNGEDNDAVNADLQARRLAAISRSRFRRITE